MKNPPHSRACMEGGDGRCSGERPGLDEKMIFSRRPVDRRGSNLSAMCP